MRDTNTRFAIGNDGKISNQISTWYSSTWISVEPSPHNIAHIFFFSENDFLEHFLSIQSILRQWTVYIAIPCHSFGIAYFRMLSLTLLILALFLFWQHNSHFGIFPFFWWTTTTTALLHCIRYGTHISAPLTISIHHPKRTGFIYSFCLRSFFSCCWYSLPLFLLLIFEFVDPLDRKGFLYVFFFVSSYQHLMMFVFFFCCYIDISGLL